MQGDSSGYTSEGYSNTVNMVYKLGFTIYQTDQDDYVVDIKLGCSENGITNEKNCSIHNKKDITRWIKSHYGGKKIPSENRWSCPWAIYIDYDSIFDQKSQVNVGLASGQCSMCWAKKDLTTDESSSSGTPFSNGAGLNVNDKEGGWNSTTYIGAGIAPSGTDDDTKGNSVYQNILNWAQNKTEGKYQYTTDDIGSPCNSVSEIGEFLSNLLWIINIIAIIILIIMTAADFIKAIVGSEDDTLKKAFKHFVIRAIIIVILFLLPLILGAIIRMMNNEAGTIEIGENGQIFCNVAKDK